MKPDGLFMQTVKPILSKALECLMEMNESRLSLKPKQLGE